MVSLFFFSFFGIYSCDAVNGYEILNSTNEELFLYTGKKYYYDLDLKEIVFVARDLSFYKLVPQK